MTPEHERQALLAKGGTEVTTYEQALNFLGAEDTALDEFIPTMVSVKVSELFALLRTSS